MRQIKLEHEINNNQIKVTSDHTTYICIFRNRELNIDQIINNYSLVIKSAKKQGVKISYKNRVKNYLLENKKQYVHDRISYNWLFNELLEYWENKVKIGIFAPTCDDQDLNDSYVLRNKIIATDNRSTVLSTVNDINNRINDLLETLSDKENNLCSITL